MKNLWNGRVRPNIEHIASLFDNTVLGAFLSGHLILEAVLVQILDENPREKDCGKYFDWGFKRKVEAARARELIASDMADFLTEVNHIRNRLAHELDTSITFSEAFGLARMAAVAGIEFTDETIIDDRSKSEEQYGIEGVIQEVFQNATYYLFFHLANDKGFDDFCCGVNEE